MRRSSTLWWSDTWNNTRVKMEAPMKTHDQEIMKNFLPYESNAKEKTPLNQS
jgi:hypothetical protein